MKKLTISIEEEARGATDCIAVVFNHAKIIELLQTQALVKCIDLTFNFHENSNFNLWRIMTSFLATSLNRWKKKRIKKVPLSC